MPTKSTTASSTSKALTKQDPAIAQFQRLAKAFLSSAPPGHHESVVPSTLCTFDRHYASGYRQTISLLQAGDQKFVQTVSGNEKYLPPSLRSVSMKRGRDLVEEDEEDEMLISSDEEEEEETPARRSSSSKKGKDKSSSSKKKETPKKKSRKSSSANHESLFTPQADDDSSPRSGPRAPRKTRSHRPTLPLSTLDENNNYDAEDFDAGERTETESTVASILGSVRRSMRHKESSLKKSAHREIKVEFTEDDLSSLCGGLENIEVQSSIDAESEYGTPAPPTPGPSTGGLRSGSVRA